MTIDEMKNKISMELRNSDTQLGFEVICKKLTELEKENEQLKAYESHWEEIEEDAKVIAKENEQLKAEKQQIKEQVKKILIDENAEIGDIKKLFGMDWYDVKEIEQLKYNLECRDDELAESKAQIEKMKCCGNCKNNIKPTTKESILFCCECKKLDETKDNIIPTKWELAE